MFLMRRKIIGARLRAAIKRAEAAALAALDKPIEGLDKVLNDAEAGAHNAADRIAAEIAAERTAAAQAAGIASADSAIERQADAAVSANG